MEYNILLKLSLLLVLISIFFFSFIGFFIFSFILITVILLNLIIMIFKEKIVVNKKEEIILIISFLIIINVLLGFIINDWYSYGFAVGVTIILIIFVVNQYMLIKINVEFLLKSILFFSSIHVFMTVIEYLIPETFISLLVSINSEVAQQANFFYSFGAYSGINLQIGQNAIYIVVCLGISLVLAIHKGKSKYFILILLSLFALLLTSKRGHLIFSILSLTPFLGIYFRDRILKSLKYIIIVFIVGGTSYYLFLRELRIFSRFNFDPNTDFTSGRGDLYRQAVEIIKEFPLLGMGMGNFEKNVGMHVHNIYLQLFAENGIFTFLLFVSIVVFNLAIIVHSRYTTNNNSYKLILDVSIYFHLFFILYGFTGNPIYDGYIYLILMLLGFSHLMIPRDQFCKSVN